MTPPDTGMTQAYGSRMLSGVITQPGPSQTAVAGLQQLHLKHGQHLECICGSPFLAAPSCSGRSRSAPLSSPLLGQAAEVCSSLGTLNTVPAHSQGDGTSCCSLAPLAPSPAAAALGKEQVHSSGPRWVSAAGQHLSPTPGTAGSALVAIHTQMWCSLPWVQMWEFT